MVQAPPSTLSTPRDTVIGPVPTMAPTAEGNLKIMNILEANSEVMCCRFNPEGGLLAVGLANGVTKVYAPDSGHCVYNLSDQDTFDNHLPVTCLRWRPTLEGDTHRNLLLATCKD